jgi:hypothetical protein
VTRFDPAFTAEIAVLESKNAAPANGVFSMWTASGDYARRRRNLGDYFLDGLFADSDALKIHVGIRGDHQRGCDSVILL